MPKIITFCNTKGGVGKTTLAVNIAALASARYETLLIDADPQATASDFYRRRAEAGKGGFTILATRKEKDLLALPDRPFPLILIDVGGRDHSLLRASLVIADLAVLPFQPRSFDIWAATDMAKLVKTAAEFNPRLTAWAILNKADASGTDNEDASKILHAAEPIRVAPIRIGNRKSIAAAAGQGLAVSEASPLNRKAADELAAFFDWLMTLCP